MTDAESAAALARARLLCELRRFAEAADLARRAIAAMPDDAEAWCLLSQALLGSDDDAAALDAARRATSLAPESEWPHRLRSIALTSLGRDAEALDAALESARCEPFAWQTHTRVAGASIAVGLKEQATAAVAKAVELAPGVSQVWVVSGDVAARNGDRQTAQASYQNALRIDPQNASAHSGLARLSFKRHGPNAAGLAAAASGFTTAVRSDPHEQHHRRAIDVVLRVFLARAAYFIFVAAYIVARTSSHSSSPAARGVSVVVLAAAALFVGRFLAKLDPRVRGHLFRTLRQGFVAIAAFADGVAVLAIVLGAFAPMRARTACAVVAVVFGLAARIVLYVERTRNFPEFAEALARWRWVGWAAAGGLLLAGLLLLAACYHTPDGLGATTSGVAAVLLAVLLATLLLRARRTR